MKKIIASAGLLALGATANHAADSMGGATADKPWDASLTVRGFYDDNYFLASQSADRKSSYGVEVRPSVGISLTGQQTSFGARYTYSMRYFADRETKIVDPVTHAEKDQSTADHSHEFNAWLWHSFSERFSLDAVDTFLISQEPTLLEPDGIATRRSNGNNMRNDGTIKLHAQLTRLVELVLGYRNVLVDYETKGGNTAFPFSTPSYSGLLDRMEHNANIDLRWQFRPETVGIFGYQFGISDYNGSEPIGIGFFPTPTILSSDSRNSRSHYVYVGLEHSFLRNLVGSVRAGVQFVSYYNSPTSDETVSPYVDLSLRYNYTTGSFVELGFQHQRNATDGFSVGTDSITTDQETSTVYAAITHAITPKLIGNLNGRYQWSTYNGGSALYDGQTDNVFLLGVSLEYRFNRHLSAEVGYNYDVVTSNIAGRDYDRNRVFLGMTASY
ncbi:MAG: outer membrane beta-barrel protein [Verrucomicrobia bacterium]|nr:outer membrane beta-barrel protein [Verrucomicrobiota bacterium]